MFYVFIRGTSDYGGKATIKRVKSGYIVGFPRGKGYYIASFPGERLLYSQFSGGGGKSG